MREVSGGCSWWKARPGKRRPKPSTRLGGSVWGQGLGAFLGDAMLVVRTHFSHFCFLWFSGEIPF